MRRARRLLPALILVLLAVACFGAFVATDDEALGLRGDLLGSLFYVQNWRSVLSGASYFTQFGSPSPLRHMWSLAIEEQWYLVWPLLLFGIMTVTRRNLRAVVASSSALAAGSALLMAALYHQGGDAIPRVLRHRHPCPGPARRRGARGPVHDARRPPHARRRRRVAGPRCCRSRVPRLGGGGAVGALDHPLPRRLLARGGRLGRA